MSYLRGPLTKEQVQQLSSVTRPQPAAPSAGAPRAPAPRRARRSRDRRDLGRPRRSPPGRPSRHLDPAAPWAVAGRRDRRHHPPARLPRDARRPALRRHGGRDRRAAGVRGALRPARRRARPRRRDGRRLRRPRLPRRRARGRHLRASRGARSARRSSSRSAAKDVQARLVANRALEIFRNRQLKLSSRPGETRGRVPRALRRGRPGEGRRGGREAEDPPRDEAGPARECARAREAARRGDRHADEVARRRTR